MVQGQASSSAQLTSLEDEIGKAIENVMQRRQTLEERFACEHDLQTVWAENNRLDRLLLAHLSLEQLDFVRGHLIKVLSILIWIGWHRWPEFGRIFLNDYDRDGKRDRLDESLPIEDEDQLAHSSFLADFSSARNFLAQQYIFIPIYIREDVDQDYPKTRRLPFVGTSGEIREGSYGKVTKEIIACRHFIQRSVNSQSCPSQTEVTIARKCLPIEDEFKDEVRNLDLLRSSLSRNTRIMTHLGTLVHGDRFNIFFPWADMDLREFIYNKWEGHREMKKPMYLLEEASNLADALAFLHNGIEIPGGRKVSCVHMDLKPENIVVNINNRKSSAGIWMITDFGISTIKPNQSVASAASARLSALSSVRDVEASLTRTVPKRKPGPFQAPEVQDTAARVVGRKSDIWSLGCILCLVLALGEGPDMVRRFDEERSRDAGSKYSTDYFYKEVNFHSASRTGAKWEVKNHVLNWLDKLAKGCNTQRDWVRDYVVLVKKMILIDMDRRPDAEKVRAELGTILKKAKAVEQSPYSSQGASPTSLDGKLQQLSVQPLAPSAGSILSSSSSKYPQGDRTGSSLSKSTSTPRSLDSNLVKLELPPGRIIRTTFSPGGDLVAFLSETHVFLYATKSLDLRGLWNKKLGHVNHLSALSGLEVKDGANGKWRSLSLSGHYLLLRGQLGVTLYQLEPLNLRESVEVTIHERLDLPRLVEAEVSCRGQIVFRFTDHLKVWCQEMSEQDGHVHSLTITGSLKAASFSSDAKFLYAWACGSGYNHWYIWHVDVETPVLACTGSYGSDHFGTPIEALVPMTNKAAFIILENQGTLSIVQKFSATSMPAYFSKLLSGIVTCTYSPAHHALFLVRSRSRWFWGRSPDRIEMLRLLSSSDGSTMFASGSGIQELGKSVCQTRDMDHCGIAVTETGAAGSLALLISHPDGVLERLKV